MSNSKRLWILESSFFFRASFDHDSKMRGRLTRRPRGMLVVTNRLSWVQSGYRKLWFASTFVARIFQIGRLCDVAGGMLIKKTICTSSFHSKTWNLENHNLIASARSDDEVRLALRCFSLRQIHTRCNGGNGRFPWWFPVERFRGWGLWQFVWKAWDEAWVRKFLEFFCLSLSPEPFGSPEFLKEENEGGSQLHHSDANKFGSWSLLLCRLKIREFLLRFDALMPLKNSGTFSSLACVPAWFVPGSKLPWNFHIIGDGKINPIVGVYIPTIRIPIKGGMTIPNIATFDHGTFVIESFALRAEVISYMMYWQS